MKHPSELTVPVELIFEVLPAMEVEGIMLPDQLDITKVLLTITGPSGKPRQVDITNTISEEQMMMFEDDIMENYQP
jgi:hypothetical protein